MARFDQLECQYAGTCKTIEKANEFGKSQGLPEFSIEEWRERCIERRAQLRRTFMAQGRDIETFFANTDDPAAACPVFVVEALEMGGVALEGAQDA